MKERCVDYLRQCHNSGEEGGFRGAPYIASHVASSYAAIIAIINIGTKEAYDLVDLPQIKKYLLSVKNNFKSKPEDSGFFSYLSDQKFSKID